MTDSTARPASSPASRPGTSPRLELFDTTLRDGTQRPGVSLSVDDKLRVARLMDELGVAYIEGGWPGANPKDTEFFRRAADGEFALEHATLVAFGMTRGPNKRAEDDALLNALVAADTEVICLVGKSWSYHVDEALQVPRAENLAMVADSIRYLTGLGKRVFFDAEHFFDGWTRDEAYTREVIQAAADAGAECVVLCDTNGGMLPDVVPASSRRSSTCCPATSGCTCTTTAVARSPTPSSACRPVPSTRRAPPTVSANGAGTRTCSPCSPTCS